VTRKLIVNDGRNQRERPLAGRVVVGRDPSCHITDTDPLLSARHAEIAVASGEVTVRDLGSRNGVLLNGVKVGQASLRSGDVMQLGGLRLTYIEDAAATTARPARYADDETMVLDEDATIARPAETIAGDEVTVVHAAEDDMTAPMRVAPTVMLAASGDAGVAVVDAAPAPAQQTTTLRTPITLLALGVWAATAIPYVWVSLRATNSPGWPIHAILLGLPLAAAILGARFLSSRIGGAAVGK